MPYSVPKEKVIEYAPEALSGFIVYTPDYIDNLHFILPPDEDIMKIALGADHAGAELKNELLETVRKLGHEPIDFGGDGSDASDDYPDYAEKVGEAIRLGEAERGILICGSGVGVSVAANKIPGIRAAIAHDTYSAHQGVEHDDMNVLVLGSRVVGPNLAGELVKAYLDAKFSGEARHVRRLNKVKKIEAKYANEGIS